MTETEIFIEIFKRSIILKPLPAYDLDMQRLWRFAKLHGIRALIAQPLLDSGIVTDAGWTEKWREEKYKNYRKTIYFRSEREKVFKELNSAGIWHIPLKGIILNDLYPSKATREFADNDIWVDPNSLEKVEQIMTGMGYKLVTTSITVHYSFNKKPYLSFEFHHRLFSDKLKRFNDYFEGLLKEIIPPDNSGFYFKMSNEDSYAYILAHAYKHYVKSGFGLRTISDIWLYRKNIPLNYEKTRAVLDLLGIRDFSDTLEALGDKIFDGKNEFSFDELSEAELEMLNNVADSGSYGNADELIKRKYKDYSKENGKGSIFGYYIRRLFPSMEPFKRSYPFLYRHKLLHPVFYVYRPIKSWFINGKALKRELKTVIKAKKEKE